MHSTFIELSPILLLPTRKKHVFGMRKKTHITLLYIVATKLNHNFIWHTYSTELIVVVFATTALQAHQFGSCPKKRINNWEKPILGVQASYFFLKSTYKKSRELLALEMSKNYYWGLFDPPRHSFKVPNESKRN